MYTLTHTIKTNARRIFSIIILIFYLSLIPQHYYKYNFLST